MSDPVYVAFATQKGGVGKSTLTALVASYLYFVEGVEVAVIDSDSTQHTMNVYRQHDLMVTKENPRLRRIMANFYRHFNKEAYKIELTSAKEAMAIAETVTQEMIERGTPPKVIFFDITGTINDRDIVLLISQMDYIFVPITTETGEMESSITFADHVNNLLVTTGDTSIKELRLVWNKINSREKTNLCNLIDNYMAMRGLSSLDTVLVKSNKFEKDGRETGNGCVFRSTMLPPEKRLLKGSNLVELVAEIRSIINV